MNIKVTPNLVDSHLDISSRQAATLNSGAMSLFHKGKFQRWLSLMTMTTPISSPAQMALSDVGIQRFSANEKQPELSLMYLQEGRIIENIFSNTESK
jgi:hypothetical protein